ncbi:sodium:proton exchanger [Candidatus Saccharibacteria bacterium]|nr:sodium:proton exchanger [Candidatus Saccharibacteria bacterium]
MNDVFLEFSTVIIVVLLVSLLMRLLRQPLIIGYILSGVLVGPLLLGVVQASDTLDVFAHFGIALLLFIIGLGLNPRIIKDVGKTAFATGIAQIVFTTAVGWLITVALGYSPLIALYIAIALAFSSTIIVLKLLSDKKENHRLYAKISIGFLLVQDICATLILIVVAALNNNNLTPDLVYGLVLKGLLLILGLWLMAGWLLPKLKNLISNNQEFLFVFAIAWGLGVGALFYSSGFSLEVGSLAAGVALASQSYAGEIASRLKPLRDFFIIMFFVSLGAAIQLGVLGEIIPQAILLSIFVLVGNPLIVMVIMGLLGFTKKTGFKAGLAVAQISEFSLIFIALVAISLESELGQKVVGLTTIVAIITITLSSYMIIYADKIYDTIAHLLNVFERKNVRSEKRVGEQPELLLIGYNKGGEQFAKAFRELGRPYLVVDYNPEIIEQLERGNLPHTYGDISDLELVEELGLHQVKLLISTLGEYEVNRFLASYLQERNLDAIFICSAEHPEQAARLYEAGASYVMLPHYIGGERILNFIKKSGIDKQAFAVFRDKHLTHIANLQAEQKTTESAQDKQSGRVKSVLRRVKPFKKK